MVKHETTTMARVTPPEEQDRMKVRYQATCGCGWKGPERFSSQIAHRDAGKHVAETKGEAE